MSNKTKKRIAGLIICVLLFIVIVSCCGCNIFSSSYVFDYELLDDGTYGIKGIAFQNGLGKPLNILEYPTEYDGIAVTAILSSSSRHPLDEEITEIIIPEGITTIEAFALQRYENLKKVTLPSTIERLGVSFIEKKVILDFSGNDIYAYENGAIIELENNVLLLGLDGCVIPESVEIITDYALSDSNFTPLNLPNVKTVGEQAFSGCSFTEIHLPNVETIGDGAFSNCTALDQISLPNVVSIGEYAFYECNSLKSITLTTKLRKLEAPIFYNCPLSALYYNGTEDQFENIAGFSTKSYLFLFNLSWQPPLDFTGCMFHFADADIWLQLVID